MKTKVLRDKPVIERCKMLPKTSVNYTRKFNDYDIDVRCRGGCEYCTDDAFYIDDLLQNPSESMRSFTTDPRVAVLGGNHAELYVENVIEINSHKSDRNSLRKKGKIDTKQ